jgi:hypothetical protein
MKNVSENNPGTIKCTLGNTVGRKFMLFLFVVVGLVGGHRLCQVYLTPDIRRYHQSAFEGYTPRPGTVLWNACPPGSHSLAKCGSVGYVNVLKPHLV